MIGVILDRVDAPLRKVAVDPPRAIVAFAGGEWWPGVLEEWEQRQDGSWWGFCTVAVMQWVKSPLAGLVHAPDRFIRWMPAEEIRERDGALVDVEAWARANHETAAPTREG